HVLIARTSCRVPFLFGHQRYGLQELPTRLRATQLPNMFDPSLGQGLPRRTWACRLHCEQRMVTSGAFSVTSEVLLVYTWAEGPCRTATVPGALSVGTAHDPWVLPKPLTVSFERL